MVVEGEQAQAQEPEAAAVAAPAPPGERARRAVPGAVWAGALLLVAAIVVGAASVYGELFGAGSGWEEAFQAAPPQRTGFGVSVLFGVAAAWLLVVGLHSSGGRPAVPPSAGDRWRRLLRVGSTLVACSVVVAIVAPVVVYSARASDDFTNAVAILVVIGLVAVPVFAGGVVLLLVALVGAVASSARRRGGRLDPPR